MTIFAFFLASLESLMGQIRNQPYHLMGGVDTAVWLLGLTPYPVGPQVFVLLLNILFLAGWPQQQ
jgi:hypothetical protein